MSSHTDHDHKGDDSPEVLERELREAKARLLDALDDVATLSVALGKASLSATRNAPRPPR